MAKSKLNPVSSAGTASTTNSYTPQATPGENIGLTTGAKAGIAIGAIVGAVSLVLLGICISKVMIWRKDSLAARTQTDIGYYSGSDLGGTYGQHPQKYAYYAEVDAVTPPVEVASHRDPVEVPDGRADIRRSRLVGALATKYS